jgi:hypothetical protein
MKGKAALLPLVMVGILVLVVATFGPMQVAAAYEHDWSALEGVHEPHDWTALEGVHEPHDWTALEGVHRRCTRATRLDSVRRCTRAT